MEHSRSYLMDECMVMACGRERSPTIITSMLMPSSCHRKQAGLGANDVRTRLLNYLLAPHLVRPLPGLNDLCY
jgi:hypothetical protein